MFGEMVRGTDIIKVTAKCTIVMLGLKWSLWLTYKVLSLLAAAKWLVKVEILLLFRELG